MCKLFDFHISQPDAARGLSWPGIAWSWPALAFPGLDCTSLACPYLAWYRLDWAGTSFTWSGLFCQVPAWSLPLLFYSAMIIACQS